MSSSAGATTPVSANLSTDKPTRYRWVVMATIFVAYVVCMADRANIGAVLPFIREEFHLDNFTIGAISSFFFLGYAVSQIPAGLIMGKKGTRAVVSNGTVGGSSTTGRIGRVPPPRPTSIS